MKAILMSIHPKWCEKIFNGEKTVEIRKTFPQQLVTPFKVYVYETVSSKLDGVYTDRDFYFVEKGEKWFLKKPQGNGKVIGEFIVNDIVELLYSDYKNRHYIEVAGLDDEGGYKYAYILTKGTCLSTNEIETYLNKKTGYAWCVSEPLLYDKPINLGAFELKRPPQSWCYVEKPYLKDNFFINENRDFFFDTFSNSFEIEKTRPPEHLFFIYEGCRIEYIYNELKERINGYSEHKYKGDSRSVTFEHTCEKKLFDVINERCRSCDFLRLEQTHTLNGNKWVLDTEDKTFIKYLVKIGKLNKEIERYNFEE